MNVILESLISSALNLRHIPKEISSSIKQKLWKASILPVEGTNGEIISKYASRCTKTMASFNLREKHMGLL